MRTDLIKSLVILVFAAVAGTAGMSYASSSIQDDGMTAGPQQQTPPDCKKNPDDPRCEK